MYLGDPKIITQEKSNSCRLHLTYTLHISQLIISI